MRTKNNQVRYIHHEKVDRRRYTADTICDRLFRIALGIGFRHLGEWQSIKLKTYLGFYMEELEEILLNGIVGSVNTGYESLKLQKSFLITYDGWSYDHARTSGCL